MKLLIIKAEGGRINMAYYRDLSIVDIKDWELGLQDGFKWEKTDTFTNDVDFKGLEVPNKVKRNLFDEYKPYIKTARGLQVLEEKTDKIATRLDGTRFVITKEQFEEYYHSDSGMFKPDLDKHAEFEYVVYQFSRFKDKIQKLNAKLNEMSSIKDISRLPGKVEKIKDEAEEALRNLKSKSKTFQRRVKEKCSCRK